MRIPDPKANTTTEAYLAYKAGYLEESELKPVLYEPYLHFDAWLAYWAGLTNEYPLDKNGDPEMLTDEEALVAYLAGVTDTYPEEIKDPYDVRIVGYLKYLVSARWGRPEYPVNNEEFYLSTMKPPVVPSGDPSSDIEMDDTVEGPFIDLKMYGDTYQQTYSGKNLIDGSYNKITQTARCTAASQGNGFTITSTSSSGATYVTIPIPNITELLGKTVTVSYTATGDGINARFYYISSSGTATDGVGNGPTITLPNSLGDNYGIGITFYTSNDSSATYNDIQLEEGSSATPFEPYTGGPAPNPDYPQDIQVVTGRQVVKVNGKNLFDKNNADILFGYINYSGVIKQGGVDTDAMFYIPCSPNTTYTVQKGLQTTTSKNRFGIGTTQAVPQYEDTLSDFWRMEDGGLDTVHTIVTSSSAKYLVVYCYGNDTEMTRQSLFDTVQVEKGSTATSYQPYQSQTYEINLGKNLLDLTTFEDGYINSSGTVSGGGGTNAVFGFMPVLPGTDYTVSAQKNSFAMSIAYYDSSKTFISRVTNDYVGRTSRTFTTPQNCAYARAGFYAGSGAGQSVMESSLPQFEIGSSASSYASYFEPIELCPLGNYQEYIYRDEDGDWYLHKETARVDVSSLSGWFASGSYAYKTRNGMGDILPASSDSSTAVGLCNAFSASTTNLVYAGSVDYGFALPGAGGVGILIRNKNVASLAEFTTYLSNNPVYGYFALATPTDTKITNSELISQLDALMEGGSYEGKTYIKVTATDPNLPGLLYVEAWKYD